MSCWRCNLLADFQNTISPTTGSANRESKYPILTRKYELRKWHNFFNRTERGFVFQASPRAEQAPLLKCTTRIVT